MIEKECARCRTVRPMAEYANNTRHRDGKQSYCRPCGADLVRDRRSRGMFKEIKQRRPKSEGSGVIAPPPFRRGAKWGAGWLELGG